MEQQCSVLTEHTDFYPGLAPVLEQIALAYPLETAAVRPVLKQLSQPWNASRRAGVPLSKSLLTPGGYPLEFNFSSGSAGVCYTADPGLPNDPAAIKWQHIKHLLPGFDEQAHTVLSPLSAQKNQRFGSWISFRHQTQGNAPVCKIYQEVTSEAYSWNSAALHSRFPEILKADLAPMLVGIFPGRESMTEYYCRIRNVSRSVLQELFNLADVGRMVPFALCCLSYLASEQESSLMKRLRLGVSLRCNAEGPPSLTLFAHAVQLFADNLRARNAILGMASQLNGKMPLYERLTESCERHSDYMAHSMVSLKFAPQGLVEIGVGWSPKGT